MNECYGEAESILKNNIEVLHTLARNLMDKETLSAEEVKAIFAAAGLKKPEAPWGHLERKWKLEDEALQARRQAEAAQAEQKTAEARTEETGKPEESLNPKGAPLLEEPSDLEERKELEEKEEKADE